MKRISVPRYTLAAFGSVLLLGQTAFGACPNFSGTWKGTCSIDNAKPFADEQVIAQEGCEKITMDGVALKIGTPNRMSHEEADIASTLTSNLKWDGQRLNMAMLLNAESKKTKAAILNLDRQSTIALEGDVLKESLQEIDTSFPQTGNPVEVKRNVSCEYRKAAFDLESYDDVTLDEETVMPTTDEVSATANFRSFYRNYYRPGFRPYYRPGFRPYYRPNFRPYYRPNFRPYYRPNFRPYYRPFYLSEQRSNASEQ